MTNKNTTIAGALSPVLPIDLFAPQAVMEIQRLQMPNAPSILHQFINLFLDKTRESITAFQTAVQQQDCAQIAFITHKMKSSCASLGAESLAGTCVSIEKAAKASDFVSVISKADDLAMQYQEVRDALLDYQHETMGKNDE